jgi:uncharacterized protein DUF2877
VLIAGAGVSRVRPTAIGAVARAALVRSHGSARVLARLTGSVYLAAGDQIAWLGGAAAPLHPRSIVAAGAPWLATDELVVAIDGLVPWRPRSLRLDAATARRIVDAFRQLLSRVERLGTPAGFGERLTGRALRWPLDAAGPAAEALASACARDDATAATSAAVALLGVGAGLTPSGDDFVGGALFARDLLARAGVAALGPWRRASRVILDAAALRTHPVSAALLADLAGGMGWAPLHDLVAALAEGTVDLADGPARRLVQLGHSSGWDLLAGFAAGLGARA